jgi:tetratricopeptide (TPR) repeat protein
MFALLAVGPPTSEAERLAGEATAQAALAPQPALAKAQKALLLTRDFDPTVFVKPGRKGEVVEDAYVEARSAYRRHRAPLYQAVGACLRQSGRPAAAAHYLGRAYLLEPSSERAVLLAQSLLARDRGLEALPLFRREALQGPIAGEALSQFLRLADALGLPSAQSALDRFRLEALGPERVELLTGPLKVPVGSRLSTGGQLRVDAGPTVLYLGEVSCRTCSADLEDLKRLTPPSARVVLVPEDADRDQALRRVVEIYGYGWPVLQGRGAAAALALTSGAVTVVGREGWTLARVRAPLTENLPPVLQILSQVEFSETTPRPLWDGRTPGPAATTLAASALLPEGWAPGEDEEQPAAFRRALDAYREGRPADALRLLAQLESEGEGWLLPPEARFNRALCLQKLGRTAEARSLLLGIGDSRFQEAVDRALEALSGNRR